MVAGEGAETPTLHTIDACEGISSLKRAFGQPSSGDILRISHGPPPPPPRAPPHPRGRRGAVLGARCSLRPRLDAEWGGVGRPPCRLHPPASWPELASFCAAPAGASSFRPERRTWNPPALACSAPSEQVFGRLLLRVPVSLWGSKAAFVFRKDPLSRSNEPRHTFEASRPLLYPHSQLSVQHHLVLWVPL